MVAEKSHKRLTGRIIPIAVAISGVVVAGIVALLPAALLETLVWRLWLPELLSAATPPIGATGRAMLGLIAGLGASAIGLAACVALPSIARRRAHAPGVAGVPVVRRADAHPDAPPRRPIRANEDLGPPLPIAAAPAARAVPEPEQPLPADLDQPLAAFDPAAIPDAPLAPVRAVTALASFEPPAPPQSAAAFIAELTDTPPAEPLPAAEPEAPAPVRPSLIDPGERFETFELTPAVRDATVRELPREETPQPTSIASLLDRLERGATRRPEPVPDAAPAPRPAPMNLDETLGMLRRLAAG